MKSGREPVKHPWTKSGQKQNENVIFSRQHRNMPKKHQQIDFFCRQHKKTLKITNKNTLYADNIKRGQATLSNVIFFRSQHELLFLQTTLPRTAWPLRILGVSVFFGRITPTTARWEQKSHHLFLAKPFYKFMSFEQFDKGQSRQSVAGALSITHVNELLLTALEAYFLEYLFRCASIS